MVGFIIIGNGNAVTYKEIFPLIKNNELWIGASKGIGGKFSFIVPNDYDNKFVYEENGVRLGQVNSACWFTNISHTKRNTPLDLYKKYSADEYPKYDNYDAIESKTAEIPMDYEGVMGVPITFLDKYCPTQFEILGIMSGAKGETFTNGNDGKAKFYLNSKGVYARILIRRKKNEEIVEYGKEFLIIGNGNAVTYKEIFPYIKNNELWIGAGKGMGGKAMEFYVNTDTYDASKGSVNRIENGKCYVGVMMCTWFTNVPHNKRNIPLDLFCKYNETDYPKYENYDAIEVSRVENIPMDYEGVMGVPITFLDKYCPNQFEIVGITENAEYLKSLYIQGCEKYDRPYVNGKRMYSRLLIRRR